MDVTPNTLIIYYDEEIGKEPLLAAIEEYNATILYQYNMFSGFAIKIPDGTDIEDAIEFFSNVDGVLQVNRDHIYTIDDPINIDVDTI